MIEEFFKEWQYTATAFFSFCGFLFIVYRVIKQEARRKSEAQSWKASIESRLDHLDNEDTGRVNKLSNLVEKQIDDCKRAEVAATRAYTTVETIFKLKRKG